VRHGDERDCSKNDEQPGGFHSWFVDCLNFLAAIYTSQP
jgi:hypothetical protein